MAKKLMLLRHGKSDWNAGLETDYERPLALRGKQAARRMAQLMVEEELEPELILSSPAKRAADTARIVQTELGDVELEELETIYEADVSELLEVVHTLPPDCSSAMLVGHNPGLEELLAELTGTPENVMKTCTLAVLESKAGTWDELSAGSCRLVELHNPRELED